MIDRGFEPGLVKPRTIKLVFVASPLSTQQYGERAKIGWLGIRIMCPNGVNVCSSGVNVYSRTVVSVS